MLAGARFGSDAAHATEGTAANPLKESAMRHHRFDIGQQVSYAEDGKPHVWRGGYDIVRLHPPGKDEPQYAIRSADQSYDRIVFEHELREDLGARVRGR
jgi:hypothetical protein